ncbi:MAG: exosortase/archaeosortase family protein [Desulfobacter sp.]|nr:MAG: exosortase/archaeosortase family protein [Desulfobacter sp.]
MSTTKSIAIQILMLLSAFAVVYHHTIVKLISDWSTDPNFSHGFLIPFVVLYMIWHEQNRLRQISIQSSKAGIFLILFGMLVHIIGNIGSELFLMRTSMVITVGGIVSYCLGNKMLKALIIPVCYLMMMIPIPSILWNKVAFPLQVIAANLSSHTISMLGIPIFREGNILHLSNTSLEVIDACSGIRSLTSLLALTGALSFLVPLSSMKKWVLFLSAVPIAIVVNVVRLTITGGLAAWVGPETAHGFLHDMSGLIIFTSALFFVYLVYLALSKIESKQS